MTKEKWFSVIRHILTFTGGLLVLKGTIEESVAEQVIASVMTLVGLVWGQVEKK